MPSMAVTLAIFNMTAKFCNVLKLSGHIVRFPLSKSKWSSMRIRRASSAFSSKIWHVVLIVALLEFGLIKLLWTLACSHCQVSVSEYIHIFLAWASTSFETLCQTGCEEAKNRNRKALGYTSPVSRNKLVTRCLLWSATLVHTTNCFSLPLIHCRRLYLRHHLSFSSSALAQNVAHSVLCSSVAKLASILAVVHQIVKFVCTPLFPILRPQWSETRKPHREQSAWAWTGRRVHNSFSSNIYIIKRGEI